MSRVFSDSELESMERVKKGDRKTKSSIFYNRAKPKIKELLEEWFPRKKELQKLIEPKRKKP